MGAGGEELKSRASTEFGSAMEAKQAGFKLLIFELLRSSLERKLLVFIHALARPRPLLPLPKRLGPFLPVHLILVLACDHLAHFDLNTSAQEHVDPHLLRLGEMIAGTFDLGELAGRG